MAGRETLTLAEIAARAGVSVGTMSNFLNRPEVVAPGTRSRIESVIEQHDWLPNVSGRTLRRGRSDLVGLLVLDIGNPFFSDVARGVEDAAESMTFPIVLCNTGGDRDRETRYLRLLEEHRARGALITPARGSQRYLVEVQRRGMQVVLLDRAATSSALSSVTVNDQLGGELAGRHLVERGHRRIGYVTGPLTIEQCADRLAGLRTALAGRRASSLDRLIAVGNAMSVVEGMRTAHELLRGRGRPTALFCANDLLALGAIRAAHDLGLRVPDDVAIVGYDDVEFAADLDPALTTVRQPKYELGRRAIELFKRQLASPDGPAVRDVLEPILVERRST